MKQMGIEIFPYLRENMDLIIFCNGERFGEGTVSSINRAPDLEEDISPATFFLDCKELGGNSEFRYITLLDPKDNGWIHFFEHPLAGSAIVPLGTKVTVLNGGTPPTYTFTPKI